jgi:hypothetical protein
MCPQTSRISGIYESLRSVTTPVIFIIMDDMPEDLEQNLARQGSYHVEIKLSGNRQYIGLGVLDWEMMCQIGEWKKPLRL